MTATAISKGIRGAVISGGIRDTKQILEQKFPLFYKYRTSNGSLGRCMITHYQVPIRIGKVTVRPGDIIFGDIDGVLCIPREIACDVLLRAEGIEPTGFWYNPNIHPMKEYKMRKNTLVEYAKSIDLKLEIENEYGLRKFIEAVYPNWDNRCATCYALRFEETARYAAEHGYDQFTSTLFVSPYQNHELMRQICEQMAEKYGVKYLHRDFSPRFREGQDKARELGLYMQNYCGCVFSEEDRYRKRKKKKQPADAQA